jgi:hypothetical protein
MVPKEYGSYNWLLEIQDLVSLLPREVLLQLSRQADGRENLPLWDMVVSDALNTKSLRREKN